MSLPSETGPLLAPDRMSVWPVEGGRYGIDATYHGVTGFERAEAQLQRLQVATTSLPAYRARSSDTPRKRRGRISRSNHPKLYGAKRNGGYWSVTSTCA